MKTITTLLAGGTIYTQAATQEVGEVLVYSLGALGAMTLITTPAPYSSTITSQATASPENTPRMFFRVRVDN